MRLSLSNKNHKYAFFTYIDQYYEVFNITYVRRDIYATVAPPFDEKLNCIRITIFLIFHGFLSFPD